MANFLASLRSSGSALDALQRSVSATQNNVSNASTPGYVRQRIALRAMEFDPASGLSGGMTTSGLISARDQFVESAVRRSLSEQGAADQNKTLLAQIERALDLNDDAGIAPALDRLFQAFSSWAQTPNSVSEKENVVSAAGDLATAFNRTDAALSRAAMEAEEHIHATMSAIENIVERIRVHNADIREGRQTDAGIDAMLNSDLESLSELINIQALWQEDGTVTILAANRGALVVGDRSYKLSVNFPPAAPDSVNPDALPQAVITDGSGNDLTDIITGGKLGALLNFRNEAVAKYLGTPDSIGELNELANEVKNRVNTILSAGSEVDPPYNLFIFGNSPGSIAHSISVNPPLGMALLDATDNSTDPPTINGKAQQLAALARPTRAEDRIHDLSYVEFFGRMSADAGRAVANAKQEADSRSMMTAQARSIREQVSGVSLDEEAIRLVEFQRAYQASARMVTVLAELTEMAVNIGRV